uniref:Uncharacterized protein n=1 Tax=Arundo donax TaxID=35708 RepID=A0A0A9ARL4_ARUDO
MSSSSYPRGEWRAAAARPPAQFYCVAGGEARGGCGLLQPRRRRMSAALRYVTMTCDDVTNRNV